MFGGRIIWLTLRTLMALLQDYARGTRWEVFPVDPVGDGACCGSR